MRKLSLKWRLLSSFSVVLLLVVVISTMSILGLRNANAELKSFIQHALASDSAVKLCRIQVNVAARTLRDMVINDSAKDITVYKDSVNANIAEVRTYVAALKNSYTKQDGLVEKYETALNAWIEIGNKVIALTESGNRVEAAKVILNECTPALSGLVEIVKELDASSMQMEKDALAKSQTDTLIYTIIIAVLLGVSVLASVLISAKVTRSIVTPVKEVENAAIEMSRGNLNLSINNAANDEVGRLADSMGSSMSTLSGYIKDIDYVMEEMAGGNFDVKLPRPFIGDFKNIENSITKFIVNMSGTLLSIRESSETVDTAAGQVSYSSQALAQGATEQAGEVDMLSASISKIADQVKENAQNANNANRLSGNVANEIASSDAKMRSLIGAMHEISTSSQEIGKIIKAIEDIAFQTNILALNAAVEAARAGAAGKGFAVVADEVRNLAAKSAEAAKNTTELIQSSVQAVANGTALADDTAKALGAVVAGAAEITDLISKISVASNEQAESSVQITTGIEQIAVVVQTNSATAEESSAASEELSGQAQMLKALVEKFKLSSTGAQEHWRSDEGMRVL